MYYLFSIWYCILFLLCLSAQGSLHTNNNDIEEIETFDLIQSWAIRELLEKKKLQVPRTRKRALAKRNLSKKEQAQLHNDISLFKEVINEGAIVGHKVNQMLCMLSVLKGLSLGVKCNIADNQQDFFPAVPNFFESFFDHTKLKQHSFQKELKKITQEVMVYPLNHSCPSSNDIDGFKYLSMSLKPLGSFVLILHKHKNSTYIPPLDLAEKFNQILYSFKPWNSIGSLYQTLNELLVGYETTDRGNNIICKHLRCFAQCLSLAPQYYIISKKRAIQLFADELDNIVQWHNIPCTRIFFTDEKGHASHI